MQKLLFLILAIVSSGVVFSVGYAVDTNTLRGVTEASNTTAIPVNTTTLPGVIQASQSPTSTPSTSSPNTIYTSEMVPGASCKCVTGGGTSESL